MENRLELAKQTHTLTKEKSDHYEGRHCRDPEGKRLIYAKTLEALRLVRQAKQHDAPTQKQQRRRDANSKHRRSQANH